MIRARSSRPVPDAKCLHIGWFWRLRLSRVSSRKFGGQALTASSCASSTPAARGSLRRPDLTSCLRADSRSPRLIAARARARQAPRRYPSGPVPGRSTDALRPNLRLAARFACPAASPDRISCVRNQLCERFRKLPAEDYWLKRAIDIVRSPRYFWQRTVGRPEASRKQPGRMDRRWCVAAVLQGAARLLDNGPLSLRAGFAL